MEKNKIFYRLSILIIVLLLFLAALILFASNRMGVQYFRLFFRIISVFLFAVTVIMLLGFFGVGNIMKHDLDSGKVSFLTRIALRYFMPFILGISKLFSYYKDDIRNVFIKANNQYVLSFGKKVPKDKILVLLPHCLQNSECSRRIRNGLNECVQCSSCNIGDIKEIVNRYGADAEIATGGTSARKIIQERNPQFVIAVACERDLTSGLMDVKGIPVYGILNQRPNGPCKDTFVDIDELEKVIENFAL